VAKATKKKAGRPRAKPLTAAQVAAREREMVEAYRHTGSTRAGRAGTVPKEFAELHLEEVVRRKQAFLDAYMRRGRMDLATQEAGILYHLPYHWARNDAEFKKAWDEAREVAAQSLEDAAYRRAKTGYLRPVYQRGMLVGMERVYSDSLAMFLLKGMKPQVYRDRVEHSGDPEKPVRQEVTHRGLSDELAETMKQKVLGVPSDGAKS
jgi:hypothetical protein